MWFDQLSHPVSLHQQGQLLHLVPALDRAPGGWTLPVKAEGCMERGGPNGFVLHPLPLITNAIVEDGIRNRQKFEKDIKLAETVKARLKFKLTWTNWRSI